MAKQRMINTRFWSDNFIRESLNPLDRYLFLYFLTNEKTSICGIYELPMSTIASETGIEREMLVKMFKRLKGKIDYVDGWVAIKNFQKYQNTNSPQIKKGIEEELSRVPSKIKDKIPHTYGIDTQSHLNLNLNSNLNLNLNLNLKREKRVASLPSSSESGEFFGSEESQETIVQWLTSEKKMQESFARLEVVKFVSYWTEKSQSGKERWRGEKYFDLRRRFATWFSRTNEFKNSKSDGKKIIIVS